MLNKRTRITTDQAGGMIVNQSTILAEHRTSAEALAQRQTRPRMRFHQVFAAVLFGGDESIR